MHSGIAIDIAYKGGSQLRPHLCTQCARRVKAVFSPFTIQSSRDKAWKKLMWGLDGGRAKTLDCSFREKENMLNNNIFTWRSVLWMLQLVCYCSNRLHFAPHDIVSHERTFCHCIGLKKRFWFKLFQSIHESIVKLRKLNLATESVQTKGDTKTKQ
jgi:hypothetical protein